MRTNTTPYQWLPEASSLANSLDFSLRYVNSTLYNVANASGSHEFTVWLDNRLMPADINLLDTENIHGTTLPPNPMIGISVIVPQGADLFVNVMHFLNHSLMNITLNNGLVEQVDEITNNLFYSGMPCS